MIENKKTKCSFCGINGDETVIKGIYGNICSKCLAKLFHDYFELQGVEFLKAHYGAQEIKEEDFYKLFNVEKETEHKKVDCAIENKDKYNPRLVKEWLDNYIVGQEDAKKILSVEICNHIKRVTNPEAHIKKTNIIMVGPSGSGKTYLLETLARYVNLPFTVLDATALTEAGYVGANVYDCISDLYNKANGDVSLAEKGIVYIDEIDKIARPKGGNVSRDIGGEGVQQSLLKMIEGTEVTLDLFPKRDEVTIDTSNILFVMGGAFEGINEIARKRTNAGKSNSLLSVNNNAQDNDYIQITSEDLFNFGMIRELVGRVPVVATLSSLTKEDLLKIMTTTKDSIVEEYKNLLKLDSIDLEFSEDALDFVADQAVKNKTGARALRGIFAKKMNDLIFDVSGSQEKNKILITKDFFA